MKFRRTHSALVAFGLLSCCINVNADDQVLQYGSKKLLRGTLGKMTKDFVELKPRTGAVQKIPSDTIRRIRFNGEKNELNLARSSEESGLLDKALERYTSVVGSLKPAAKKDTEFLIARTKCRMALADPTKVEDAIASMQAALAKNSTGFRYYECLMWLGRVHVAKADYPTAQTRFDALGQSPMKSHQMTSKVAIGQLLLAQDKPAEAQTSFEQVVAMQAGSTAETASRYEAVLGKAKCQQLQQDYAAALKSLDSIIANTDPAEAGELHARAHVQRGDCFSDQQNAKNAVMAYLHVDVITEYSRAKGAHAEALFKLSQLWAAAGRPERGSEAAAKLKKLYPNNNWTKKL
ncbi:MAG: tetratricopeptide repeat protein [Planctomycetaceae bacterium]